MGIEIEYPLGYANSGDTLFRDTGNGGDGREDVVWGALIFVAFVRENVRSVSVATGQS